MEAKNVDTKYNDDKNSNNRLFRFCLHEIRNMKSLDTSMINNIRDISNDEKMELIIAYNDVINSFKILLDDLIVSY
jgi:hypothetical protein